ncbi:apses-domain-containing protein [Hypoxylon trugodes]|uniref:apses-domain-containing protein n=1 Tax=Hypoxylon trugodes TaxID=326681 RepID=UPI0021A17B56|nr:apses-domain-containing protein [Hypoxylon trugodes]KAI1383811.1 apses-domain-containing protein [Hypoxylon trugodes]
MSQSQPSSQQSFTMSQPASQTYRQFSDSGMRLGNGNGHGHDHEAPQIYSAIYSGTDVYEMEVNGVAVMRRREDSWLNATQILKVANIDKGKRTKILEKEIQTGEHEKVQGGYGKYQGTWIKFERGVEVCRQYGVEELLRPLLTYDMGQDGGVAGRGDFNTPTKEQAMAAQRKRMYSANSEGRANGLSGTFFKNISSTASTAVAAISKARFDSPGPRGRNGPTRPPSFSRQSSMQNADDFPGNSQQSFTSDYGQNVDTAYSAQNSQIFNGDEPPRKRQRVVTPADSFGYASQSMEIYANNFPGSPTEPNESFVYSQAGIDIHESDAVPLPPLPFDLSPEAERKRSLVMGLFLDPSTNASDYSQNEALQTLSPLDLDAPIDPPSHTALHWAATLARIPLLRALISAGANPYRVNASGETALMRASAVTNNSDNVTFPDLLDLLGNTIDVRDNKGRTVLHHIAVTSAVKGRNHSSRYYLESLLEWVVRQGSAPSSQNTAAGGGLSQTKMGIGRFMSEIVNAQDKSGDTALNIAARIGNKSIISQLLEVGAEPTIANKAGLRPTDFGVGEVGEDGTNGDLIVADKANVAGNCQKTRESSAEIITSITHLLNETSTSFHAELKKKQHDVDSLHASLRTTSTQLGDARRQLETLQATAKSQSLARQKINNLSRGYEEEQKRLVRQEQTYGRFDADNSWETELNSALDSIGGDTTNGALLPSSAVLQARIQALKNRRDTTKKNVGLLKSRSKDVEVKYRRVVALCTGVPEGEVDVVIDGLLRAVESEKGELEMGRIRRFLGGVDAVH